MKQKRPHTEDRSTDRESFVKFFVRYSEEDSTSNASSFSQTSLLSPFPLAHRQSGSARKQTGPWQPNKMFHTNKKRQLDGTDATLHARRRSLATGQVVLSEEHSCLMSGQCACLLRLASEADPTQQTCSRLFSSSLSVLVLPQATASNHNHDLAWRRECN